MKEKFGVDGSGGQRLAGEGEEGGHREAAQEHQEHQESSVRCHHGIGEGCFDSMQHPLAPGACQRLLRVRNGNRFP